MINQFLGVRSIELKDGLTEQEYFKKKEISRDIKYGYDRKKNMDDSSEHSSSKKEDGTAEVFDNDVDMALSPNFTKEPDSFRIEYEDLEQTLAAGNNERIPEKRHLAFLLSCCSLLIANADFAVSYHQNGGIFFLIPYFLFLFFVAFPLSLFESSLGQYASVPIFSMFHKIAPILGGIPYLIFFNRFISLVSVAIQPKLYLYTVRMFFTLITDADQWAHCKYYPNVLCYEALKDCALNEYFDGKKCVNEEGDSDIKFISPYVLIDFARARYIKHAGFSASTLFSIAKTMDVSDNLTAVLVFFAICGFLSYRGYRFYTKFAIVSVVLPFLVQIPIFVIAVKGIYESRANNVLREITDANSLSNIMTTTTLFDAFRLACTTMELANGTLLTLGSKQPFKSNFFKNMILLAIFGSFSRICFTFVMTPLYFYLSLIIAPESHQNRMEAVDMRFSIIEMLFEALPVSTDVKLNGKIFHFFLGLFYFSINLGSISYQLITFEILMSYVYHKLTRLLYVTSKYVRLIVLVIYISIIMITENDYFHQNIKPGGSHRRLFDVNWFIIHYFMTLLCQFSGIHAIYGNERVFVNCLTMLRGHDSDISFKLFTFFKRSFVTIWYLVPIVIIHSLCDFFTFTFEYVNYEIIIYTLMASFPFLYAIRISVVAMVAGQKLGLLGLTHQWCPRNANNARAAFIDEKGFRIIHK